MVKIQRPQDPDEYEGAPLSLGSERPMLAGDRLRERDVAHTLAEAIVDQGPAVCEGTLEYLDRCARSRPADERARAAAVAAGLIRQAQQSRSAG
jgi:hypothetical protein